LAKLDHWMTRLRDMGKHHGKERVLIGAKYETMTSTQACRYQELKSEDLPASAARPLPADQPYYTLTEAAERLTADAGALLSMAAGGRLQCFVNTAGLRGRWQPGGPAGNVPKPLHLAVGGDCLKQIASYGSANLAALEHPLDAGGAAVFQLAEPLWVDASRLLLRHPLPSA